MSDILSYIQNNPQETQRLIGVKYKQLEQLMKQAITLHTEKQQEREAKIRIINKGGWSWVKLSNEDQILLTLTYLRHLTTFQLWVYSLESVNQPPTIHLITGFQFYKISCHQVY